jgi:hypothetical protein
MRSGKGRGGAEWSGINTYGNAYNIFVGNPKERNHLMNLGVDGAIILKSMITVGDVNTKTGRGLGPFAGLGDDGGGCACCNRIRTCYVNTLYVIRCILELSACLLTYVTILASKS